MMKLSTIFWLLSLIWVSNTGWAYGGGGSGGTKSCEKPKFTDFVPAENAKVAAGSAFSFTASKNTYPESIKVSVKEQPAVVTSVKKNDGTIAVSGKLPTSVKGAYARITITADAQSNCKGTGGWLVKIAE